MDHYTDQEIWDEAVKRGIIRALSAQRRVTDFELSMRADDYRGFIRQQLTRRLATEVGQSNAFTFHEQSSPWGDDEQIFTALMHIASVGRMSDAEGGA